jgi:dihydroflavonol-4-reductase
LGDEVNARRFFVRPTLVTGASGFLGWHVARLLLARGERVRVLARKAGAVEGLDCEVVQGDLRDAASLRRAVEGCGTVFHVAADYRLWVRDAADMRRSNVDGTRDLLEAARAAGVERVVYTSTVGCIGFVREGLADETSPVSYADMTGAYKQTKFEAEQVAVAAAKDLDVVIVNPTAPVGERDWKPTPTGKTILDFLKGKIPAFVDTGLNVVDVHDCAEGHLLARELHSGQRESALARDSGAIGAVDGAEGADGADPVFCGVHGGLVFDGACVDDGPGAGCAAGCGEDGEEEDVRVVGEGAAGARLPAESGH